MSITERNSDLTTLDTDRIMSSEDGAKLIENMNKSTVKDHTLFLFQNGYPKTKIPHYKTLKRKKNPSFLHHSGLTGIINQLVVFRVVFRKCYKLSS